MKSVVGNKKIVKLKNKLNNLKSIAIAAVIMLSGVTTIGVSPVSAAAPQDTYSWQKHIGTSGCISIMDTKGIAVANGRVYVLDGQRGALNMVGVNQMAVRVFNMTGSLLFSFGLLGVADGQLSSSAQGIAADSAGNIYIADGSNNRIQKFDADGNFLSKFGTAGSGDGQFSWPQGIALDSAGNIYVTDTSNNRIQKFDNSGVFLMKFGANGSGNGQFSSPRSVAVDSTGAIFVADSSSRIQKFTSAGVYQSQFGSAGTGNGQFGVGGYRYLAIDTNDTVVVSDGGNRRIQKFSTAGVYQSQFGSIGLGNGQFTRNSHIAIGPMNEIFVGDLNYPYGGVYGSEYGRVERFNAAGAYQLSYSYNLNNDPSTLCEPRMSKIGPDGNLYVLDSSFWNGVGWGNIKVYNPATGALIKTIGTRGSGVGQLRESASFDFDGSGNIFIVDSNRGKVLKYYPDGTFASEWGTLGAGIGQIASDTADMTIDRDDNLLITFKDGFSTARIQKFSPSGLYLGSFGSYGSGLGQFRWPSSIRVDKATGDIYVSDRNLNRINVYDGQGVAIRQFGSFGGTPGQYNGPMGLDFDATGALFIADIWNMRVQKVAQDGSALGMFGSAGSGNGQFDEPIGVTSDKNGNVYVSDNNNSRISVWNAPIVPSAPQNVTISAQARSLAVTWQSPQYLGSSPLTGYRIMLRIQGATIWQIAGETNATTTQFNVTGLNPSATYEVQVLALNALGSSIESATDSGVVVAGVTLPVSGERLASTGNSLYGVAALVLVALLAGAFVAGKSFLMRRRA